MCHYAGLNLQPHWPFSDVVCLQQNIFSLFMQLTKYISPDRNGGGNREASLWSATGETREECDSDSAPILNMVLKPLLEYITYPYAIILMTHSV